MPRIENILVPVDFSSRTEAEAEHAVNIARHFGARLIFLHVIPMYGKVHSADPDAAEAYAQQFSADVAKGVERSSKCGHIPAKYWASRASASMPNVITHQHGGCRCC